MSDWAFTRLGSPDYCETVPKKLHMGAGASMSLGTHFGGSVEKVGVASDPKRVGPAS